MRLNRPFALLTVLALGFAAPDAEYPARDLGAPPLTVQRHVRMVGMNAGGQVLLTITGSSDQGRSYLWSPDGTSTPVGAPAGVAFPTVYGLSDSGQVLASYVGADSYDRSYVWSAADGVQPLLLPNATSSQAVGITAGGVVAGTCQMPGGTRAFRWTAADGIVDLGIPSDFPDYFNPGVRATCVSPAGDVAGVVNLFGQDMAFAWTAAGGLALLGSFNDPVRATPTVMGEGGHVVGAAQSAPTFLYTPGSGTVYLPFDFSVQNLEFKAINATGVAIGTAFHNGLRSALRWTGGPAVEFLVSDPVESSVGGINAAGVIAGTAGTPFQSSAYIWTPGSGYQALPGLPGALNDSPNASAINAANQIGGSGRGPDFQLHLIRWEADLTPTDLGVLGFVDTARFFINDAGTVAGYGSTWAARAAAGAGVQQYPLPAIGGSSTAVAANASGQVVGFQDSADGTRAFVWSQGFGFQQLGLLPGAPYGVSAAIGIDDAGNVGGYSNSAAISVHLFLYSTSTGQMEDLGAPAGATNVQPTIMTSNGLMAGFFGTSSGVNGTFKWTRSGGLQVLPPLVADRSTQPSFVSRTGHVLGFATDVNFQLKPVLWPAAGGVVELSDPSLPNGYLAGVSDDGTVGLQNGVNLPQLRLLDGTRVVLSLPGFTGGYLTKVTPEGIVLGYLNGSPLGAHAFYWTAATGIVDLSGPSDSVTEFPHVANAAFHIGGVQYVNGEYRLFLWTPGGGFQDLGASPIGGYNMTAVSIGEGDRLLVNVTLGSSTRSLVWTSAGGLRALDPIDGGNGANGKGSGAAGRIVFGTSTTADGDIHAAVWGAVPVSGSPVPHVTLVINGNNVVVDASGSTDPDGDPLSFQWYVGNTLIGTGSNAAFTVPDGTTSVRLVVTDPSGAVTEQIVPLSQVDTTPPVAGTVYDGIPGDLAFQSSANTISASWSGFSDPQSGITKYEWAIGTTSGGTQVQGFVDIGPLTSATRAGLTLLQGKKYYATVRATNGAGMTVLKSSNGVTVDLTPPKLTKIRNGLGPVDIDWQTSLATMSANWDAATDDTSGIAGYEWAIGTTAGGTQVQGFVSVGAATNATATGLTLTNGTTYFVTVRATNGAGLKATKSSDCITVDSTPPVAGTAKITDAKKTTVTATWKDFKDPEGGIISYEWAIGSTPGASNLRGFLLAGNTGATATGLNLTKGTMIYVTVRAYNKAGLSSSAVSPGATVK